MYYYKTKLIIKFNKLNRINIVIIFYKTWVNIILINYRKGKINRYK
jgi:hypothetical protein